MRDDVCNQAMDISASGMKKNECNACSKLKLQPPGSWLSFSLSLTAPVSSGGLGRRCTQFYVHLGSNLMNEILMGPRVELKRNSWLLLSRKLFCARRQGLKKNLS